MKQPYGTLQQAMVMRVVGDQEARAGVQQQQTVEETFGRQQGSVWTEPQAATTQTAQAIHSAERATADADA